MGTKVSGEVAEQIDDAARAQSGRRDLDPRPSRRRNNDCKTRTQCFSCVCVRAAAATAVAALLQHACLPACLAARLPACQSLVSQALQGIRQIKKPLPASLTRFSLSLPCDPSRHQACSRTVGKSRGLPLASRARVLRPHARPPSSFQGRLAVGRRQGCKEMQTCSPLDKQPVSEGRRRR